MLPVSVFAVLVDESCENFDFTQSAKFLAVALAGADSLRSLNFRHQRLPQLYFNYFPVRYDANKTRKGKSLMSFTAYDV